MAWARGSVASPSTNDLSIFSSSTQRKALSGSPVGVSVGPVGDHPALHAFCFVHGNVGTAEEIARIGFVRA
jgi:hypothetical protein